MTDLPALTLAEFRDAVRPAIEEIIDSKPLRGGGTRIDLSDVALVTDVNSFFLEEERTDPTGTLAELTKAEFRQLVTDAIVVLFTPLSRLGGGRVDLTTVRMQYHTNRSLRIEVAP